MDIFFISESEFSCMEEHQAIQEKLKTRSYQLALKVIYIHKSVTINYQEAMLSKKFIENGTAVGEYIVEAIATSSKMDFSYFLTKSYQALAKTEYWLELLHESGYVEIESFNALLEEIQYLRKTTDEFAQLLALKR